MRTYPATTNSPVWSQWNSLRPQQREGSDGTLAATPPRGVRGELEGSLPRAGLRRPSGLKAGALAGETLELVNSITESPLMYTISRDHLRISLRLQIKDMLAQVPISTASTSLFKDVVEPAMIAAVDKAMQMTGGNQVKAAKILGINRNTLRKHLKLRA